MNAWIVIPCYNESPEVVLHTVQELQPYGYPVVLVDDGSRQPLAKSLPPSAFPHGMAVHLLRHPINRGQGAALQTGMEFARRNGAQAVVHFDADGQHDHRDIPRFLAALEEPGVDVVLGSRFLRAEDLTAVPPMKRIMLRGARIINGLLTGMWLTDAHNGFRALGKNSLEAIQMTEDRMAHASEILWLIRRAKLQCREVPTYVSYTNYSMAKGQSMSNSVNILIDLLLGRWL